ncbi:MAG: methylitaconate delta2-delta3-isomerase [Rhodospirillales bacterium]|uniref:2-methylaconitate cis-trans isomerase PrpF family protein n=1 Tax=Acidiphilium sp. PM TaxID=1043206 RepID=UPI000214478D|nr:PrpF domain-containing protein [Acidiphilium sp. PM]EGO96916.1 Methylitaconate delta2-delta3-isomerase [Acidiphilium sp. PM]MBU6357839.1 methylitaconate delta2-delta3-isomerase [Rhodospirillales bacterium]
MESPHSAPPEPIRVSYPRQRSLRCLFMRGGSSRGGFFLGEDLPADERERGALLLAAFGSPDMRQIDGIGGADALTSKAAIVAPSTRPDADVDYTFCQVSLDSAQIGVGGTCGNMLAGVGPFAIIRGLVPPTAPETTVRIHATNTGQVIIARIPVEDGLPAIEGDCAIPGVPGTGARIGLDFGDCSGAVSGHLLPTGNAYDRISLDGVAAAVSLVDAATPFVFVRASDLGRKGTESAASIAADEELLARLEAVRGWAATVLGLAASPGTARAASPNVPRVIMVAPPQDYETPEGMIVGAGDVDLCVRQMSMQRPHKALAVTGSICTAVAAAVAGSVIAESALGWRGGPIRLGHPAGVLRVNADIAAEGEKFHIRSAEVERTARPIMDGVLYVPAAKIEALARVVTISGAKPAGD